MKNGNKYTSYSDKCKVLLCILWGNDVPLPTNEAKWDNGRNGNEADCHRWGHVGHRTRGGHGVAPAGVARGCGRPAGREVEGDRSLGSRPGEASADGRHPRGCPGATARLGGRVGRDGRIPALRGHREAEPRPDAGHRATHGGDQRHRLHPRNEYGLRLVPLARRRAHHRHQLHSGHQGTGRGAGLLRHQAFPEHLPRCPGTTGTDATPAHPLHGHPPGIRGHRLAPGRQALPHADASRTGGRPHRPRPGAQGAGLRHRPE